MFFFDFRHKHKVVYNINQILFLTLIEYPPKFPGQHYEYSFRRFRQHQYLPVNFFLQITT